jgi:uncharacterized damage-inducible protein DinB
VPATEYMRTLVAYNRWANLRLMDAAERVTAAQRVQPMGLSFGSIFGTLVHVLGPERVWRLRIAQGQSPFALVSPTDFQDLAALRRAWDEEMGELEAFTQALDDAALEREVVYRNLSGEEQQSPLWHILLHVVNHGTQFRAEAAVGLSQLGASPGGLDLIAWLREQDAARHRG